MTNEQKTIEQKISEFQRELALIYQNAGSRQAIESQCLNCIFTDGGRHGSGVYAPGESTKNSVYGAIRRVGVDPKTIEEQLGHEYLFDDCIMARELVAIVQKNLEGQ